MKKAGLRMMAVFLALGLAGCASNSGDGGDGTTSQTSDVRQPSGTVQTNEENAGSAERILYIHVGDSVMEAELENNSSAAALLDLLKDGSLTLSMRDYGNFEKVGDLGASLPANDEQITTKPGDLILYQGHQFVIYYDTNSWNFTKLGEIINATPGQLRSLLGEGDVTVTLTAEA